MRRLIFVLAFAVGAVGMAKASGFGLYEASAPTYALGGAVVGRAVDASANFHNPATLSDLTNITVTAGFMTEHPRARIKAGGSSRALDPGCFWLPSFQLAVPLPLHLTFGLGMMPEYGLGSNYPSNWELANNSTETTIMSATVNPNLAWQITDDWSVGVGARILYLDFEQHSRPLTQAGRFHNRLKGDNGMSDVGWQIGTRYRLFDNFSVGLVYKSATDVQVKGTTRNHAENAAAQPYADAASGHARANFTLPQSVTGGFNWDIIDTVHLGGMISWTQWSEIDTINFHLKNQIHPARLKWTDTVRFGIAPSWDFAERWTVMGSYVFDEDCCGQQESTMLPASHRHMVTGGILWRCTDSLEFSFCYGMILMDGERTQARDAENNLVRYRAHRGLSHAVGVSVTYRF